ncbi:MAG TPA: hypothetical protein VGB72_05640, partial [Acidobacteriota bacterium]
MAKAKMFPSENRSLPPPEYGEGWYGWEYDKVLAFRWMSSQARLTLPEAVVRDFRYLVFPVFSEYTDYSQHLILTIGGRQAAELPLLFQWAYYSVDLRSASSTSGELRLSLNKVFPAKYHPGDGRELG